MRDRTWDAFRDRLVYTHRACPDGIFLLHAGGGRKIAQVWVRKNEEPPWLWDGALLRELSRLSLLVIIRDDLRFVGTLRDEIATVLEQVDP